MVTFSEFPGAHTHGATYMEAAKHGQEVLALLIETYVQEDRPLPESARYQYVEEYPSEATDNPGALRQWKTDIR